MRSKPVSLALTATLLLAGCGSKQSAPTQNLTARSVLMQASGAGKALITYGNSDIKIRQETVFLPWSTTMTVRTGIGITLRVRTFDGSPMQCKILISGQDSVLESAQGPNSVAACTTHS